MWRMVFLILYLVITAIHLYGCLKQDQKIRNLTKPFLMPMLAGFYVFGASTVNPVVFALILTSWLGDMLLMIPGMKWFTMGGISFLLTHVLLIWLYIPNISWSIQCLTVLLLYLILGFGIIRSEQGCLKRYMPKTNLWMILSYLSANITMNLFAALQAVSNLNHGSGLILIGSLLFLASDSILFLVRFDKKQPFYRQHFNVMLTYALAKFLIVLGFIFA